MKILFICHLLFWNSGKVNFRVNSRENQRSAVILLGQTVHSFYREGHLSRCFDTKYSISISSYLHDTYKKMLTFPIRRYYFMKVLAIIIYVFEIEMQAFIL